MKISKETKRRLLLVLDELEVALEEMEGLNMKAPYDWPEPLEANETDSKEKILTVGQLKEILKDVPDDLLVATFDGEWGEGYVYYEDLAKCCRVKTWKNDVYKGFGEGWEEVERTGFIIGDYEDAPEET